jgi:hypothetical protein
VSSAPSGSPVRSASWPACAGTCRWRFGSRAERAAAHPELSVADLVVQLREERERLELLTAVDDDAASARGFLLVL